MRDPFAEIVAYNQPLLSHEVPRDKSGEDLTREALKRKLEALAASPFHYFRGTFHLMASDVLRGRVPHAEAASPQGLIVGDVHLENFGVYRGQSGEVCFDINDFDDVGQGPLDLDVRRLCTSALLLPGVSAPLRSKAARQIADGWAQEILRLGGRFPVHAWRAANASGLVRKLLRQADHERREKLIGRIAPNKGEKSFDDPKRFARPTKAWGRVVENAFADYLESLHQLKAPDPPDDWKILDLAYEFKGIGSLGRLRFAVLVGKRRERRLFELKEARASAMDVARAIRSGGNRGRAQAAAIRRLQADPWPRVAASRFGRRSALGRENDSADRKVTVDLFARRAVDGVQLQDYARQCGQVLARLHCRYNAPALFHSDWSVPDAARKALTFARAYAQHVRADYKALLARKAELGAALGL